MRNELYQHKKSDKVKWVIAGISLVLVFVILAGLCVQLFAPDGKKITDWFKKDDTQQTVPEIPDENESGAFISGKEEYGVRLTSARLLPSNYSSYGVSAYAESANIITATVLPENADFKQLDWGLEFVPRENIASDIEWVEGKNVTDYLTLIPTSDGANTAILTCLQPFAVSIQYKVSLRADEEVYAIGTVDYLKRISSFSVYIEDGGSIWLDGDGTDDEYECGTSTRFTYVSNGETSRSKSSSTSSRYMKIDVSYTDGSWKTGTSSTVCFPSIYSVKLTHSEEYISALKTTGVFNSSLTVQSKILSAGTSNIDYKTFGLTSLCSGANFPLTMLEGQTGFYNADSTISSRRNACVEALRSIGNVPFMTLTVVVVYTELVSEYGFDTEITYDIPIYADLNSLQISADSISIDNELIVL